MWDIQLTRVGRPTCFVIEGMETGENGQPLLLLSGLRHSEFYSLGHPALHCDSEPFGAFL